MYKNLVTIAMTAMLIVGLSGCAINVGNQDARGGQNASATFGNISVADGQSAGRLESTNGNVEIGANAKVKVVDVVNGNIEVDSFTHAKSLATVNGNIMATNNVTTVGDVKTVNGNIDFQQNAEIGGNIETVNGDIILGRDSQVLGDIIFNQSGGYFFGKNDKTPKLKLSEGVVIRGQIHLYREVNLTLPDSVSSNKVIRHYEDES